MKAYRCEMRETNITYNGRCRKQGKHICISCGKAICGECSEETPLGDHICSECKE
jgi:hypothetical protein